MFNNIAIAAAHALEARGLKRIAIVDYDVHHGNGTQTAFWQDDRVLFISLHQDSNYPVGSGGQLGWQQSAGTASLAGRLPAGAGSPAETVPALHLHRPRDFQCFLAAPQPCYGTCISSYFAHLVEALHNYRSSVRLPAALLHHTPHDLDV